LHCDEAEKDEALFTFRVTVDQRRYKTKQSQAENTRERYRNLETKTRRHDEEEVGSIVIREANFDKRNERFSAFNFQLFPKIQNANSNTNMCSAKRSEKYRIMIAFLFCSVFLFCNCNYYCLV
jgi:hypothetical protein